MNLEVEADDIHQVFESHSWELTNEELVKLIDDETEVVIYCQTTDRVFHFDRKGTDVLPNTGLKWLQISAAVNNALTCYKVILDEKKRASTQISMWEIQCHQYQRNEWSTYNI